MAFQFVGIFLPLNDICIHTFIHRVFPPNLEILAQPWSKVHALIFTKLMLLPEQGFSARRGKKTVSCQRPCPNYPKMLFSFLSVISF